MGLIERLKHRINLGRLSRLSESQRQFIVQHFGSFTANMFKLNQRNFIDKGYEKNVDVYAAIAKLAAVSKNARWVVEKRKRGTIDEWEEIQDNSLTELIAMPNKTKKFTWGDIIEQTIVYLLAGGNGINLGLSASSEPGGQIDELDILPNRFVNVKTTKDWFDPIEEYIFRIESFKATFTKEEIQHFTLFNPGYGTIKESVWGLSPIQVAAQVVQSGNDRWDADAALMQNRGAIGLITQRTGPEGYPMTDKEIEAQQEQWDSTTTRPERFGRIKVSNKDLRFVQMAMSPSDLKLIEHGVVNLRAICNVLGLDSSLFNDPDNKTFANRKEAEKAMYQDAAIPLNIRLATGYTQWLVPTHFPNEPAGNIRMRADFSDVPALQDDLNEKSARVTGQKTAGVITANEARDQLDQPASEDENADKLITTSNNILLESLNSENANED